MVKKVKAQIKNILKYCAIIFLFIWNLCFVNIVAEENEFQLAKIECQKKTIAELFDIGGKPNEPGFMGGMPWPIDELKVRSAKEVKAEAIKRLKNKPIQKHDQVFAVYCLVKIFNDDEDLPNILYKVYPKVDSKAQYQILLYAYENNVELFKDYFFKKLDKFQPPFSCSDMLAVLFFSAYPDKKVLQSLNKLKSTKIGAHYILDGFPYSDLVLGSVNNPRERIQEAIKQIENEKKSSNEKLLTKKTRDMILKPNRESFSFSGLNLKETIDRLNLVYNQNSIVLCETIEDKTINLKLNKVTVYESLANLCNTNSLEIFNNANGFSIDNSSSNQWYWAHNGILIDVHFIPFVKSPILGISNIYGIPWLNFPLPKVSCVKIKMPDDSEYLCPSHSVFQLPISKEDYQSKGGYFKEISAILHLPIPKVIKRKAISFEEAKNYDSSFSGRKLQITITPQNEGDYLIKVKSNLINEDVFSNINTFSDLSVISMLDKDSKQIHGDYLVASQKEYTMKVTSKPETFVWTVTTEVEIIKIPFSFKDIKIPDKLWP